jgi:DNA polymerase I-like protein with 3'-5' exonuclease and polymerase domains
MAEALSSRVKLKVSLEVDVATGPNWLDVEEIKIG